MSWRLGRTGEGCTGRGRAGLARGPDGAGRGWRDGGPRRRGLQARGVGDRESRACVRRALGEWAMAHRALGALSCAARDSRLRRVLAGEAYAGGTGRETARPPRATDRRVRCLLMFPARRSGGNGEAGRDAAADAVRACVLVGAGATDRYSAAMASCSCELARGSKWHHRRRRSAPACSSGVIRIH